MPVRVHPEFAKASNKANRKKWQAYWREYNGKVRSKSFYLKKDAEEYSRKKQIEIARGTYLSPVAEEEKLISVKEYAYNVPLVLSMSSKDSTRERNEGIRKNQIMPYLGDIPVIKLSNKIIQDWINTLAMQNYAAATIKMARGELQKIINKAIAEGLLTHNPMQQLITPIVKPVRKGSDPGNYLSPEECNLLIQTASFCCANAVENEKSITGHEGICYKPYATLFETAIWTGLRKGELLALRTSDIDLENGVINISKSYTKGVDGTTKTKSSIRKVPIGPIMCTVLETQIKKYNKSEFVFETLFGKRLNESKVTKVLNEITQVLGIRTKERAVTFHSLRHTYTALARREDRTEEQIQKVVGHSDIRTTSYHYGAKYDEIEKPLSEKL